MPKLISEMGRERKWKEASSLMKVVREKPQLRGQENSLVLESRVLLI
jgi:hypothetical protein